MRLCVRSECIKMAEQKIVITIDENGSVHAKTDGFQGSDCLDALDELLELDGMVSDMKKTDAYEQESNVRISRELRIGKK